MTEKMTCPDCGVTMNHHAEKIVYFEEAEQKPSAPGWHIEEIHTCPICGKAGSRRSELAE